MRERKPLGRKAYGSIGHMPGSRRGPGDHGVHDGQGAICTVKPRDRHDTVIVQEKLDGSNVAVARVDGRLVALNRAGYVCWSSRRAQHHMFAHWLFRNESSFDWLDEGWRVCGEWLAQAHGTRYDLVGLRLPPFVAFDLMSGTRRAPLAEFESTVKGIPRARVIHVGGALPIDDAMAMLGDKGQYGALDQVEGAVWRVERRGEVDFLAKYVRPDKVDGSYLPELTGKPPVWNWTPLDLST